MPSRFSTYQSRCFRALGQITTGFAASFKHCSVFTNSTFGRYVSRMVRWRTRFSYWTGRDCCTVCINMTDHSELQQGLKSPVCKLQWCPQPPVHHPSPVGRPLSFYQHVHYSQFFFSFVKIRQPPRAQTSAAPSPSMSVPTRPLFIRPVPRVRPFCPRGSMLPDARTHLRPNPPISVNPLRLSVE